MIENRLKDSDKPLAEIKKIIKSRLDLLKQTIPINEWTIVITIWGEKKYDIEMFYRWCYSKFFKNRYREHSFIYTPYAPHEETITYELREYGHGHRDPFERGGYKVLHHEIVKDLENE
ncbi:unnamed protein product [marine sediment metagenome]|uniref:Uncharacterized protein n=1 Tax=marine sediment metagenome TaxID=412755 RepID=X1CQU1_9ZZZZ